MTPCIQRVYMIPRLKKVHLVLKIAVFFTVSVQKDQRETAARLGCV